MNEPWLALNWPLWLLVLGWIVTIAVTIWLHPRTLGVLLFALVTYLGVHIKMWDWISVMWWLLFILGFAGVVWVLAKSFRTIWGGRFALLGAFGTIALLVVAFVLAVLGLAGVTVAHALGIEDWFKVKPSASPSSTVSPTTTPTPTRTPTPTPTPTPTVTVTQVTTNADAVARAFDKYAQDNGFKKGELSVGRVDWSQNQEDNVGGRFGERIESREELKALINSSTPTGKALRDNIKWHLPMDEWHRAYDASGFIPVQYLVDTCYSGNAVISDKGVVSHGGRACAKKGDVVWVFVTKKGQIIWKGSVRADCANPHYIQPPKPVRPTPVKPTTRPTKPVVTKPTPTRPTPTKPTTQPRCPYNPRYLPGDERCLNPKSKDEDDYIWPTSKPKPTADPTAEKTPAPVRTQPRPTATATIPAPRATPTPTRTQPPTTVDPTQTHTSAPPPNW